MQISIVKPQNKLQRKETAPYPKALGQSRGVRRFTAYFNFQENRLKL
jgi:hypothetical protein